MTILIENDETFPAFDVESVRRRFPAFQEAFTASVTGHRGPAVFFDNPGGTQVPDSVVEAMTDYLIRRNANTHGVFQTSRRTDETIAHAHESVAALLGADADEIVFGPNMTTLTFHLSRSLAAEFGPGDEILVTHLDHDANIAPWLLLARDTGATVKWVEIEPGDCRLDMADFDRKISRRTKLVAAGYASNATGTINEVRAIVEKAREAGAWSFIDAVQFAPHGPIDVHELGCDYLACSAYKFFGPHAGHLYGKREILKRLAPYKVRPAGDEIPGRWETGTQNHEAMAGVSAAVEYLAGLAEITGTPVGGSLRQRLMRSWRAVAGYERRLILRLIDGLGSIPGVRIYGITSRERMEQRLATVSLRKEGTTPRLLAERLAAHNIFCWHGNFYALALSQRLSLESAGGFLRLGLVHYNTIEEIDRCLEVLDKS